MINMKFQMKHLEKDLITFIEKAKNSFERRSRIIAVRLYLIGVIQKSELEEAAILAKRTIGEYNRTIGKQDETYTEEMYVYGTPFKTAYAYLVGNFNHFFTRFKYLIRTYGEENVEIHRIGANYSADSVVALLKIEHRAVHNVKYVTYELIEGGLLRADFDSKDALRKDYTLSKKELELALKERQFVRAGKLVQLKIVPSSVEVSYLKEIQRTEDFIRSLERALLMAPDVKEQKALTKQINHQQRELETCEQLLKQDEHHNQRVAKLKGVNPDEAWNKIAICLKEQYQNQKKAVIKLFSDELVDLLDDCSRIDYERFYNITKDMTRIEYILKDLKRYEYELEDYCILVKLKHTVTV